LKYRVVPKWKRKEVAPPPATTLWDDISALANNEMFSDITFVIEDSGIHLFAHKVTTYLQKEFICIVGDHGSSISIFPFLSQMELERIKSK
jgi:hypothetical protein